MISRNTNFRRINYCGAYKISEDSRMWLTSSFKNNVLIYVYNEEFGKDLDLSDFVQNNDPITEEEDPGPTAQELKDILND